MKCLYLIKIGELALKGKNRNLFEKQLRRNIKTQLKGLETKLSWTHGRYFLECDESEEQDVVQSLGNVFGIVGFAKANRCGKSMPAMIKQALELAGMMVTSSKTFKVETKRTDKSFPLNSYGVSAKIGEVILNAYSGFSVDVHNPDWILNVEIREDCYLFGETLPGSGGLPVGSAGRGTILLSGGIDSPVAAYLMAKRGLKLDAVYFHAYPYTSEKALTKVQDLAKLIAPYLNGVSFFVIPFTNLQLHIRNKAHSDEVTLLSRACMMDIASRLTANRDGNCLVTGESLSQVASQTVQSISFTQTASTLPVFRPLIGMDKEEIISLARRIGTFETSILPFDDCCTVFSPKHPLVKPVTERMIKSLQKLDAGELINNCVESAERHYFPPVNRKTAETSGDSSDA